MGKILIGLAIVLLDFIVKLGGGRVLDLTPDVLGYILMIFGLREMGKFSDKLMNAYKVNCFAAIAAGAVFAVNLITGQDNMSATIILFGIAEMVLQVVLLVFLATGLSDMEKEFGITMHSKWLKIIAICIAPGIVLGYAGLLLPILEMIGSLVVDAACFAYLILFYFTWENYKAWREGNAD